MNWYKKARYLDSPEKWKEVAELLEIELSREPTKYEIILRLQKDMYDLTSDSWPQLTPEKRPVKKTPQPTSELALV